MIKKETVELSENRCGGEGIITVHKIFNEEEMNGHGRGVNWMEFPAGASIGHHQHKGSSEQFYVLEGEGLFDDNGTVVPIKAGESGIMQANGWHGIENTGNTPMKVIAVHVYE